MTWKYFLPVYDLSLLSLNSVYQSTEVLNFDEVNISILFFYENHTFNVVSKKSLSQFFKFIFL